MHVNNNNPLESAIAEWTATIGLTGIDGLSGTGFGPCTTGAERYVPLVLRPETADQIPQILQISRKWKVGIYPISTGRNWGYGSANPVDDGCVLLDLSNLDRITDFDPALGVVTVEPGVTQEKLRAFLDGQNADYLVPVTGAGPSCSLMGNALDRGYGITPITDHFAAVTALEAVLPDGKLYRTPLTELGGGEVDRLFKWGVGPYLDGLFTQGNFGVVVRMTIALAPKPESVTAFFFSVKDDKMLEKLVPAVRQVLRTLSGNVAAINLLNRQRMLSMMVPFPADKASDGVLPASEVEILSRAHGIHTWNGVGAIYASREVAKAARRTLRRLLGPVTDRLIFVDARKVALARRLAHLLPRKPATRLTRLVETLDGALDIMNGRPNDVALSLAYWRSGRFPEAGTPKNPARDGCGLIWYAPLVPIRGEDARRYVEMIERICPEYGINPLITLTTINDRCFDSTVPLLFDRGDENATRRANACYTALLKAGQEEGFLPYRLNIDNMATMNENDSVSSALATQLKTAIDPHHLLSPGRYVATPRRHEGS